MLQAQLDVLNGAEGYAGNFAFLLQGIDYTANDAWYSGIACAPGMLTANPADIPKRISSMLSHGLCLCFCT